MTITPILGTPTWSLFRDDPVDHVRTIAASSGHSYYQCSVCNDRIWTDNDESLEDFLCFHDSCKGE
jgi:hypothetical protein